MDGRDAAHLASGTCVAVGMTRNTSADIPSSLESSSSSPFRSGNMLLIIVSEALSLYLHSSTSMSSIRNSLPESSSWMSSEK